MRARGAVAILVAGLALVCAIGLVIPLPSHSAEITISPQGEAPPPPKPGVERTSVPVPDCAVAFCVVPRVIMERHEAEDALMGAEIERLRAQVDALMKLKTVKCGTVERTS